VPIFLKIVERVENFFEKYRKMIKNGEI
jgi:hypothetical protein